MRFFFYCCWNNKVSRRVPVERRFHPKGGASAQQPKAERASHSAVVRPQAAETSRSTTSEPVGQPVYRCAGAYLAAALTLQASGTGQLALTAIEHSPICCLGMVGLKLEECWFKPTRREWFKRFLVQDRLRASDVLHRDWDWSGWR
jgi:hypothetical protein